MNQLFAIPVRVHAVAKNNSPMPEFVDWMMQGAGESFTAARREGDFFFKHDGEVWLKAL